MKKQKKTIELADIEASVSAWEESIHWIAKGWDCIEEYTCDLSKREHLDQYLAAYEGSPLPEDLQRRIAEADRRFIELTDKSERCVWGGDLSSQCQYDPVAHWYYFRWQRD